MSEEKAKTCEYEFVSAIHSYSCNRPLHDDEYCIFHSHDIERKKEQFKEAFWKEFERQKEQEEEYNFEGFVFLWNFSFSNKEFDKDVHFVDALFSGEADFDNAKFIGKANFREAQFSKYASFSVAQFSGGADFGEAQFSRDAHFEAAKFSERVSFSVAEFFNMAYFSDAQFTGEVTFRSVLFSGGADFKGAKFSGKSDFINVTFKDFSECLMTDTSFYNVSGLLERFAEYKKKFKHPRGIKYLHEKCKPILGEATVSRLPLLSREVRDDIYLMSFKEKHPRLHFLWWLFADCGRSIWRWAAWSIALAFIFGFIFADYQCPEWLPQPLQDFFSCLDPKFQISVGRLPTVFTPYYFSVVTFTTLGFGDVIPVNLAGEIWLTMEVIAGYVMLGGLISILANKLARRS